MSIVEIFSNTFWEVGTALVPLIVPVIGLFIVFRLIKDLMR